MIGKRKSHIQTGQEGEMIAAAYLKQQQVSIIAQNVRTDYGEIDIIGKQEGCIIFFEVKTRQSHRFGFPETAVDIHKQEHMIKSAVAYLQARDILDSEWRIDVIAVNLYPYQEPKIRWFKNAVSN